MWPNNGSGPVVPMGPPFAMDFVEGSFDGCVF